MTNHPNRRRFSTDEIRQYLTDRYDAEQVGTGTELDEEAAGLYDGEADAWLVLGTMPNTSETGWFFAGHTSDIVSDMRSERQ